MKDSTAISSLSNAWQRTEDDRTEKSEALTLGPQGLSLDDKKSTSSSTVSISEILLAQGMASLRQGDPATPAQRFQMRANRKLRKALEDQPIDSGQDFTLNKLKLSEVGIVGREREIEILSSHLHKANPVRLRPSDGHGNPQETELSPTLIAITGRSGTGKSLLVQHILKEGNADSGYVCRNRFEESMGSTFVDIFKAIDDLVEQILVRDALIVEKLRSELLESTHLYTLESYIPSLAKLLNTTSGSIAFKTETEPPFQLLCSLATSLIHRICKSSNSLVIMVLDDMQWADLPSLDFLEALLVGVRNTNLIFITTCRDAEEIGGNFYKKIESLRDRGAHVEECRLQNLGLDSINCIVGTLLNAPLDTTIGLARIVHAKTLGNPSYAIQFVRSLVEDRHLKYAMASLSWTWDEEKIRSLHVTDNVVVLLIANLECLPVESHLVLQVASFLGTSFEEESFMLVAEHVRLCRLFGNQSHLLDARAVQRALQAASRVSIMERHFTKYSFAHEQIHAAIFSSVPQSKHAALQLRVGEKLLSKQQKGSENHAELFLGVDLCNNSRSIVQGAELMGLAEYNYVAGKLSIGKSAFVRAVHYLETAIELVGGADSRAKYPTLWLKIKLALAEASYGAGDFVKCHANTAHIMSLEDIRFDQKVPVYLTNLWALGAQGRFEEVASVGVTVLKELGLTHLTTKPSRFQILGHIIKAKLAMRNYDSYDLYRLPTMEEGRYSMAMEVIRVMSTILYASHEMLFVLLVLAGLQLTLKHGITESSAPSVAGFAMVMTNMLGDVKGGIELGEIALRMSQRSKDKKIIATTTSALYAYMYHWGNDMRKCSKPLLYGYQIGIESGAAHVANMNKVHYHLIQYLTAAQPLDALERDLKRCLEEFAPYQQHLVLGLTKVLHQVTLNLLDKNSKTNHPNGNSKDTNPLVLTGSTMNEDVMLEEAHAKGNKLLVVVIHATALQVACLMNDYESAAAHRSALVHEYGTVIGRGSLAVTRCYFYRALTSVVLASSASLRRRNNIHVLHHRSKCRQLMRRLKSWFGKGTIECLHFVHLLEAEIAAYLDRKEKSIVTELYQQAVKTAGRGGHLHDMALANERAGRYFLNPSLGNDPYWAMYHFDCAIQAYNDWGATAVTNRLIRELRPQLLQYSHCSESTRRLSMRTVT